jgi:hypothetical protein
VLEDEITGLEAIEARARTTLAHQARKFAKLIFDRNTHIAYRRMFLDEHGELRPEAVRVIADLAAHALIGVPDGVRTSDADLRDRAGRRTLFLHLMRRLDVSGVEMRKIALKLREGPNE